MASSIDVASESATEGKEAADAFFSGRATGGTTNKEDFVIDFGGPFLVPTVLGRVAGCELVAVDDPGILTVAGGRDAWLSSCLKTRGCVVLIPSMTGSMARWKSIFSSFCNSFNTPKAAVRTVASESPSLSAAS